MCSSMTFQVESVVESFATIVADESLDVVVTLDVSIEESLQIERLLTDAAFETIFNSLLQYSFFRNSCYQLDVRRFIRIRQNTMMIVNLLCFRSFPNNCAF